ncbi:MAG: ATP-binding protein [Candidatus Riflebacteria bacterium]|nr:ATP-binding protein [Candidatus Riflebacteria bacterium]
MKNSEKPRRVFFEFKNPRYLRIVRDNAEVIARRMGFEEDQVFELAMVVDEAYANAVEHSGRLVELSSLEVEFLIYSNRLEVCVKDTGCGFDSACLKIPRNLRSLESTRGRGLGLIKMLSDSFELSSTPGSGTIIRIIKYLSGQQRIKVA